MKKDSVIKDRDKYIGGSDIPIIMELSQFMKRFSLLLQKGGVEENTFTGNCYTDYGDEMEPKIRDYINNHNLSNKPYKEDTLINGNIRCNVDGYNGESILEIKTTSRIHSDLEDYKVYLVQLLFYMMNYKVEKGVLAVYERPEDFNTEFDVKRLHLYYLTIDRFEGLCEEIKDSVKLFLEDLEKVKANPFITEEELVPVDVKDLAERVLLLEKQLKVYGDLKTKYDTFKEKLHIAMTNANLKTWELSGGTIITNVNDGADTTKKVFDEKKFKKEHEEEYNDYLIDKVVKGRKGYIRITLKEDSNE